MASLKKEYSDDHVLHAVSIYFVQAFNSVPHISFHQKLQSYGVLGLMLEILRSFLNGETLTTNIDNTSQPPPIIAEVPQDWTLSPPTLSRIYQRPLLNTSRQHCHVCRRLDSLEPDPKLLHSAIDNPKRWSEVWAFHANGDKCVSMNLAEQANTDSQSTELQLWTKSVVTKYEISA